MIDISKIDYSQLDRPEILMYLFHPRPEFGRSMSVSDAVDMMIPVEGEIAVGGRFHLTGESAGNILFFHGNGEIVADYDEFGQMMNQLGINFLAVDYRGYGRSSGQPTVTAMMRDCHLIFNYAKEWLEKNDYKGPLVPMGRSLGSASVLELAFHYAAGINGLIVESGFAYAGPLLALLGIDTAGIGFEEADGFRNIDKIHTFHKPTLIIHAEKDHIIPFSDGEALFEACPAPNKTILKIPAANHNNILMHGLEDYLGAIVSLLQGLMPDRDR
jgi:alpha-beta hydrolase superfamily lysophospholipase